MASILNTFEINYSNPVDGVTLRVINVFILPNLELAFNLDHQVIYTV